MAYSKQKVSKALYDQRVLLLLGIRRFNNYINRLRLTIALMLSISISYAQNIELVIPKPFPNVISDLRFSADNKFLAVTGDDKVQLWDINSGSFLKELGADSFHLSGIEFSANGKYLVFYGTESPKDVLVWNLANLKIQARFKVDIPYYTNPFLAHNSNSLYAFRKADKFLDPDTLSIYNLENGKREVQYTFLNQGAVLRNELALDNVDDVFISSESANNFMASLPMHINKVNLKNLRSENLDWVIDDAKLKEEFFSFVTIIDSARTILLATSNTDPSTNKWHTYFRFYNLKTKEKTADLISDFQSYNVNCNWRNGTVLIFKINGVSNHLAWFNSRSTAITDTLLKPNEIMISDVQQLYDPCLFLLNSNKLISKTQTENGYIQYILDLNKNSCDSFASGAASSMFYYSLDPNANRMSVFNNHNINFVSIDKKPIDANKKVTFINDYINLYVVKPIWTLADKILGGVFTISKVPLPQI